MDFNTNNDGDDALLVTFFTKAMVNKAKSTEAGRDIYEDRDYVRIMVKGDTKSIVERKASDADKKRFARQFEAYKNGREMATEGTPLEQWSLLSPARVMTLKANGFRTVEDVATAEDHQISGLGMGARDLIDRAKEFTTDPSDVEKKLRTQNAALKREVKNLKAQLEAATAEVAA